MDLKASRDRPVQYPGPRGRDVLTRIRDLHPEPRDHSPLSRSTGGSEPSTPPYLGGVLTHIRRVEPEAVRHLGCSHSRGSECQWNCGVPRASSRAKSDGHPEGPIQSGNPGECGGTREIRSIEILQHGCGRYGPGCNGS